MMHAFSDSEVWAGVGDGWRHLHGRFRELGYSIEWHDFEAGEEGFEDGFAGFCGFVEVAEAEGVPIGSIPPFRATILPRGIVADRTDADEEVDVAKDFGE